MYNNKKGNHVIPNKHKGYLDWIKMMLQVRIFGCKWKKYNSNALWQKNHSWAHRIQGSKHTNCREERGAGGHLGQSEVEREVDQALDSSRTFALCFSPLAGFFFLITACFPPQGWEDSCHQLSNWISLLPKLLPNSRTAHGEEQVHPIGSVTWNSHFWPGKANPCDNVRDPV